MTVYEYQNKLPLKKYFESKYTPTEKEQEVLETLAEIRNNVEKQKAKLAELESAIYWKFIKEREPQ